MCGWWGWLTDFHGFQSLTSVMLTWQVCRTCTLSSLCCSSSRSSSSYTTRTCTLCSSLQRISSGLHPLPLVSVTPDQPSLASLDSGEGTSSPRSASACNKQTVGYYSNTKILNRCEMTYMLSVKLSNMLSLSWRVKPIFGAVGLFSVKQP